MKRRNLVHLALGLSLSLASLSAQETTTTEEPEELTVATAEPIYWPPSGRPGIAASVRSGTFDANHVVYLYMEAADMDWYSRVLQDWAPTKPGAHESLAVRHRVYADPRMSISIFKEGEFLKDDYSDETLFGYAAGLGAHHRGVVEVHNEGEFLPRRKPLILSKRWAFFEYTLTRVIEEEEVVTRHRDVIFFPDGHLYIARLSAPPELYDKLQVEFYRWIFSFHPGQPTS